MQVRGYKAFIIEHHVSVVFLDNIDLVLQKQSFEKDLLIFGKHCREKIQLVADPRLTMLLNKGFCRLVKKLINA